MFVCYKWARISSSEGLTGLSFDVEIVTIVTRSWVSLPLVVVVVLVLLLLDTFVVYVKLFLLPKTLGLNLSFICCCCWLLCCCCCCCWSNFSWSSSWMQIVVDEEDLSAAGETISISARVERWEEVDTWCVSKLVEDWPLLLAIDSVLSLFSIGDLVVLVSSEDDCVFNVFAFGAWWCRER